MSGNIYSNMLNQLSFEAHTNAIKHGFYYDIDEIMDYCTVNDKPALYEIARRDFVLAQLAKIASEVGEAVSCIQRSDTYNGLNEELADITIRTMDLAAFQMYNHGDDVLAKMKKNAERPYKHGKTC